MNVDLWIWDSPGQSTHRVDTSKNGVSRANNGWFL